MMKPYAPLTSADRAIVEAINAGCTSVKEIAQRLKLSEKTVYSRLGYIKAKFGVDTLWELIRVVKD